MIRGLVTIESWAQTCAWRDHRASLELAIGRRLGSCVVNLGTWPTPVAFAGHWKCPRPDIADAAVLDHLADRSSKQSPCSLCETARPRHFWNAQADYDAKNRSGRTTAIRDKFAHAEIQRYRLAPPGDSDEPDQVVPVESRPRVDSRWREKDSVLRIHGLLGTG